MEKEAKQPHDDHQYILALLENNSSLIEEIYVAHSEKVKNFVLKNSGNIEDAADLFQDALMTISRQFSIPGKVLTCPFGAYLMMVVRSLWLNELSRRRQKRVTISDLKGFTDEQTQYDFPFSENDILKEKLFKEYFLRLSEKCRAILEGAWTGIPQAELAENLNISYAFLRKKKSECISKLIQSIQESPMYKIIKS
jgi:RNA polymerase sigma factor (sigma-70 family)